MTKRFLSFLFLMVFVLFFGCAPTTKIKTVVPPKVSGMGGVRKVAILDFRNDPRGEVRSLVESGLSSTRIGGRPYFTLADRENIKKIIKEMDIQMTYGDIEKAADIGNMLQVDAIITGAVLSRNVSDASFTEKRSKCLEWKGIICKKSYKYKVNCRKRVATFSFVPKIIRVETSKIVYSEEFRATRSDKVCSDSQRPIKPSGQLIYDAEKEAVSKFIKSISPHEVVMNVVLMSKYEKKDKRIDDLIKRGIAFIKSGRPDRAIDFFKKALSLDKDSYVINYDLGVCEEAFGNLKKAYEYYKRADMLVNKPKSEINSALKRVSASLKAKEMMKKEKGVY